MNDDLLFLANLMKDYNEFVNEEATDFTNYLFNTFNEDILKLNYIFNKYDLSLFITTENVPYYTEIDKNCYFDKNKYNEDKKNKKEYQNNSYKLIFRLSNINDNKFIDLIKQTDYPYNNNKLLIDKVLQELKSINLVITEEYHAKYLETEIVANMNILNSLINKLIEYSKNIDENKEYICNRIIN